MPWWVEYKKLICFVVVLISSSIATKLIFGVIEIDLGAVSMFDVLSISVAFFAIAISFAFYFQASNTSNQFYDNTYKFTNEVSEILGRIEGAFGEKLSHLDNSYSRMDAKLDQRLATRATEEMLEENKDEVSSTLDEQKFLIEELLNMAEATGEKRDEFYQKWKDSQERLMHAQGEISDLKLKLSSLSSSGVSLVDEEDVEWMKRRVKRYLSKKVSASRIGASGLSEARDDVVKEWYYSASDGFNSTFRRDMSKLGFEQNGSLTITGLDLVRTIALEEAKGKRL